MDQVHSVLVLELSVQQACPSCIGQVAHFGVSHVASLFPGQVTSLLCPRPMGVLESQDYHLCQSLAGIRSRRGPSARCLMPARCLRVIGNASGWEM